MARHEFEESLPAADRLPAPWEGFFERETAKAWHYTLDDWLAEHPIRRADMMAHEIEKSLREAYQMEMRNPERKKRQEKQANLPWVQYRKKFGV